MKRILWTIAPVAAMALCFGTSAFAAPTAELELVSGTSTLFVLDNGTVVCSGPACSAGGFAATGDNSPAVGAVSAAATNFNGWNVTLTGGGSNSPFCTGLNDAGCLGDTSINATSHGGSSLAIYFADSGFNPSSNYTVTFAATAMTAPTGGTASATQTAYNFSGALPLGSGVTNPVPVTGNVSAGLTITSPGLGAMPTSLAGGDSDLELGTVFTTTGPTGEAYSFQVTGDILAAPEPASGLLLGSFLWATGLLVRKRMHSKRA